MYLVGYSVDSFSEMNLRCVLSSSAPLLPLVPRPKEFQASGRGSNSRRPRRARWILAVLRPCRSCQALSSLVNVVPCPVVPSSRLPGKRQFASLLQPEPGWEGRRDPFSARAVSWKSVAMWRDTESRSGSRGGPWPKASQVKTQESFRTKDNMGRNLVERRK